MMRDTGNGGHADIVRVAVRRPRLHGLGGIFDAFIDEVVRSLNGTTGRPNLGAGTDVRSIAAKFGIEFLA
jgi:hypothetical protein